ncbi:hypothetical protein ACN8ZM_40740 (plasmid) [Burkholderia aenigmatica]|uniref:hypothetical protein n=1 Tax=Burkholderia aenigmatica TaxID=2015348 RepID=UPI003B43244B
MSDTTDMNLADAATEWTDEDSGAMLRAIDAIERIASGMTQTSADHLFAKTKPRKMTITDAKELASVHLPVLRRLFRKMEGFHVAASPVEQLVAAPTMQQMFEYDHVVSICDAHGICLPVDCIEMVVDIVRLSGLLAARAASAGRPADFVSAEFESWIAALLGVDEGEQFRDRICTAIKTLKARASVNRSADERTTFSANDLDFEPDAQHTVADMANIGYALLEQIARMAPGYRWNDSPVEIVSDLINERDEARASSSNQPGAEGAKAVAYRVLRRNTVSGEWVSDGRHWNDGAPTAALLAETAARSDEWRVEVAYASAQAAEPVAQWQYSVLTPGYEGDWHNCNAETAQRLQQPDLADFHKVRALYAASLPLAQAATREGMTDALRQAREELSLVEWENDPPARVTELLTTIDALLVASPDQRAGGNRANC